MPKKGWGPKARAAAALARKQKSVAGNISRARDAQRRSNAKLGTKGTTGANSAIKGYRKADAFKKAAGGAQPTGKTQPHKALPNTPVNHSLAAPMKAPGVAKPTGPQAFTHRAPGGKVGNSRMTPTAQARNYKSQAKSARTPVFGTKKRYPSSKRKGK